MRELRPSQFQRYFPRPRETFTRPTNALSRAEEFVAVGQKQNALDILKEYLAGRRPRQWDDTYEALMKRFVELCVDLRKVHIAREGLQQYKFISQNFDVMSLEAVVRHMFQVVTKRLEIAVKLEAEKGNAGDVLAKAAMTDEAETPDTILQSAFAISIKDDTEDEDETDKEDASPAVWFKFIWEIIRAVIEILRFNQKMEKLYREVSFFGFEFCKKHNRQNSFKRLCEALRYHLSNMIKHARENPATAQILRTETQQNLLEIRFKQLFTAVELEMWQEAFRTFEDIHRITGFATNVLAPNMLGSFYRKLADIFWVSRDYLFLAYSMRCVYINLRDGGESMKEAVKELASEVLLCALIIPPVAKFVEEKEQRYWEVPIDKEKRQHTADLLGFQFEPSRVVLLDELVNILPVLPSSHAKARELYHVLEKSEQPLNLFPKVVKIFDELVADVPKLDRYRDALYKVVFIRFMNGIAESFDSIKLDRLRRFCPVYDDLKLQRLIDETVKASHVDARIEQDSRIVRFRTTSLKSQGSMRSKLLTMAQSLESVVDSVSMHGAKSRAAARIALHEEVLVSLESDRSKQLTSRKLQIDDVRRMNEERKELQEKQEQERKKLEKKEMMDQEKERQAAEAERRKKEREEKLRKEKEVAEIKARLSELEKGSKQYAMKAKSKLASVDLATVDKEAFLKEQQDLYHKELEARELAAVTLVKRLDHLERGRREAERKLWGARFDAERTKMKELRAEEIAKREAELKKAEEKRNRNRALMESLKQLRDEYVENAMKKRTEEYEAKVAAQAERVNKRRVVAVARELEKLRLQKKEDLMKERRQVEIRKQMEEADAARADRDEYNRGSMERGGFRGDRDSKTGSGFSRRAVDRSNDDRDRPPPRRYDQDAPERGDDGPRRGGYEDRPRRDEGGYGRRDEPARRGYGDERRGGYGESRGGYGESRGGYGESRGGYGESRGGYGDRRDDGPRRGGYEDRPRRDEGGYGRRDEPPRRGYGDERRGGYGDRRDEGPRRSGYEDRPRRDEGGYGGRRIEMSRGDIGRRRGEDRDERPRGPPGDSEKRGDGYTYSR